MCDRNVPDCEGLNVAHALSQLHTVGSRGSHLSIPSEVRANSLSDNPMMFLAAGIV